jgi:hypothetical protein
MGLLHGWDGWLPGFAGWHDFMAVWQVGLPGSMV